MLLWKTQTHQESVPQNGGVLKLSITQGWVGKRGFERITFRNFPTGHRH